MSGVQFLRCREAWLTGILDDLDQRNPYEYLKGMVNCHRMHLFDVVNQYRAIFADDTSGNEDNYDGGLLFDWAMHQITLHLKTLKLMLPKITEGGSLSNILDQCMVRIGYLIVLFKERRTVIPTINSIKRGQTFIKKKSKKFKTEAGRMHFFFFISRNLKAKH